MRNRIFQICIVLSLTIVFSFFSISLYSQCSGTATAATSGNWNSGAPAGRATWTFTGGATSPNNACLIVIPNGITVTINNSQSWIGSVEVYGTLTLNSQLNLGTATGCGLTLKVFGSGQLNTTGGGASDRLIICTKTIVTGQPVPPAGAIDWPADNSFSAADLGGSGGGFGESGILPIELLFFKAFKGLNKISLSWATASELNFDYFDVEKSSDGKNFQSIAKVSGHGTTNERKDYALDDEKPYIGKNYYRLKSVDFDGYTEYFNVVLVDFDGSKGFSISPNPSDGVTFIAETNFIPETHAYIAIYSTLGSEIGRFEVFGDKSQLTMPVKLASGLYYARYISRDFTSTNRVVVK